MESPPLNLGKIPVELKNLPQWVNWKYQIRNGKTTKIPINPRTGGKAQPNNPQTWATFAQAIKYFSKHRAKGIAGIGFVVSENDPISGTDLDHCRDPQTGEIEPWAAGIVSELKSYSEVTPSGAGLRIWTKGKLPPGRNRKDNIEMYKDGRFFTVTGQHLEGTPATIEPREERLKIIHARIFGQPAKPMPIPQLWDWGNNEIDLADSELLERAKQAENGAKFAKLWSGEWNGYPSQSEADFALCSMLAFWTGGDPVRIDGLFRQSGLMRPKWNERRGERSYGEVTIKKAIDQTSEVYTGKIPHHPDERPDIPLSPLPPIAAREAHGETISGVIEVIQNLTDLGNARRFASAHGQDLRYCFPWGRWLAWDGKRWKTDETGEVFRRAKETIQSLYREAAAATDDDRRRKVGKHALASESGSKIRAMISLAQSELPILPDEMDRDPWLLNVLNGTLDLKWGCHRPHRREDLITKIAPVEPRPDAECPFWLEHLNKIFQGNASLIAFLRRALGYSLTGVTDERALFVAHGSGANGKSTTHEIFAQILGDYAVRTPTETILVRGEGRIPNDLAKLQGARFVYCSEVEEGKRLAESHIKDLTGNDTISARFMRGEWFEFQPSFKLWLATNHKPLIRGTDNAIWSRIHLIPYVVSIPEADRIPRSKMMERLTPELPGILAWAVRGCLNWVKSGLGTPDEVREATEAYRDEMDILGGFIKEYCVVSEKARSGAKELYSGYIKWATENGEKVVSQKEFGTRLGQRGFKNGRMIHGGRFGWAGIGLKISPQGGEKVKGE